MKNSFSSPRMLHFIRWLARIWATLVIILSIMIAVVPESDAGQDSQPSPLVEMIGLAGYGLAALGLLAAWRWEVAGGIVAFLGVLVHDTFFYIAKGARAEWVTGNLIVGVIFLVPAALFIIHWSLARRQVAG